MTRPARRPVLSRWAIWWLIAVVWWTLDGITGATNYHRMGALAGNPIPLEYALRTALLSAWLWVPATVLALWAAERFPLERGAWRRHAWAHLPGWSSCKRWITSRREPTTCACTRASGPTWCVTP